MQKKTKYTQYQDNSILPHKHCPVCNKMIPEDEDYCSDQCSGHSKSKDKKGKRKIYIFIIAYVVVIAAFIIFAVVGS